MTLTILSIAYPFAPVTADPAGGAEQVLAQLDRGTVAAGHRSLVIAAEGSAVAGELVAVPVPPGVIDDAIRGATEARVQQTIDAVLAREAVDVVHHHGFDFAAYRTPASIPVVVTLHLPLDWYAAAALGARAGRKLFPVSTSQASRAPTGVELQPPIAGGVDLDWYRRGMRGDAAVVLGRVAPEKGFADAIDAAKRAGVPLVVAGQVFPYEAHQRYFTHEVLPRLDAERRWIGAVAGKMKRDLLAGARCVLIPSTAPETGSLVAMEALASGVPVVAYRAGALPDIVEDGVTGFIVDGVDGMAAAIGKADAIDPAACRRSAVARFDVRQMIAAYLAVYERVTK